MPVKKLHCTAQIQLQKRKACSNIMEIAPNIRSCVQLVGNLNSFIARLFVFVALRPMSTAMVIAGRSVHLTTLFPGQT